MNSQQQPTAPISNLAHTTSSLPIASLAQSNSPSLPADDITSIINQHCVLESEQIDAIVLWLVASYLIDSFRIFPKLALISPEKRCGKTTTMELINAFSKDGLLVSNITGAAIYRITEKYKPTLLIDEADTFLKNSDSDLTGLINSSQTRAGANVLRCVGDNHEPKSFSTWMPMVLASIGDLPSTIMDRSVAINLRRKKAHEQTLPIPVDLFVLNEPYRDKITKWCNHNATSIKSAIFLPPQGNNDRATDNWTPLFTVAHAIGGSWPARAKQAYKKLTTPSELELPTRLLLAIRDHFKASNSDKVQSNDLVAKLCNDPNGPWLECNNGRKINGNQIARLLRPYGVEPKTLRFGDNVRRGYLKEDFKDSFERYLP